MDFKFSRLKPSDVEVRIQSVNKGGVQLILYKDARCDQRILDETVGPGNWQRRHLRDNKNCVVLIWNADLEQWIAKEDTGSETAGEYADKSVASDSFKRACFNWGIGRELYTAPEIFIERGELAHFVQDKERFYCNDRFRVLDIQYEKDADGNDLPVIASLTIGISYYGKVYSRKTFAGRYAISEDTQQAENNEQGNKNANPTAPVAGPKPSESETMQDDEVLLIGSCKGQTYASVKGTAKFISFCKWAANSNKQYPSAEENAQFMKLKKLVEKEGA